MKEHLSTKLLKLASIFAFITLSLESSVNSETQEIEIDDSDPLFEVEASTGTMMSRPDFEKNFAFKGRFLANLDKVYKQIQDFQSFVRDTRVDPALSLVVFYSDQHCPQCNRQQEVLTEVYERYTKQIK